MLCHNSAAIAGDKLVSAQGILLPTRVCAMINKIHLFQGSVWRTVLMLIFLLEVAGPDQDH